MIRTVNEVYTEIRV